MDYQKRFEITLAETKRNMGVREKQVEPIVQDAEFDACPNVIWCKPEDPINFKMKGGLLSIKKWIQENGFEKTTKKESTALLTVGTLSSGGSWQKGVKFYWLKVKQ